MHNHIIYKNNITIRKKNLVGKINQIMEIPDCGVYIIFDNNDYENFENGRYRKYALHMNIKVGGIEDISPPDILETMENNDCNQIIWLSKKIVEEVDIFFTWVYSHELQHLLQDIYCPGLSIISNFLSLTYGRIDPNMKKYCIEIPSEFDAEKKAKEIVTKIFGHDACNSYIENECRNPEGKGYFEKFNELEYSLAHFNTQIETLKILRKYKNQFIAEKEKLRDFHNLDIQKICSIKTLPIPLHYCI